MFNVRVELLFLTLFVFSKAIKIMKKLDTNALDEFSLMWKISHENIIIFYEHFDQEIDYLDYTCVVTEYCEVYS